MNLGEVYGAFVMKDQGTGVLKAAIAGMMGISREGPGAASAIGGINNAMGGLTSSLGGWLKLGVGLAGISAGIALIQSTIDGASQAAIGINAELETTIMQFTTLTGSSKRANEIVGNLYEFAKKTPFETPGIIQASRLMQTFGGDALNTMENLTMFADAAAGTSAPLENVAMNVGRIYAALQGGRGLGDEAMRLQELGILTPQTRTQLEMAKKQGKSFEEQWAMLRAELGRFGGASERMAVTWAGVTSTLADTLNLSIATIFKPMFEVIRDMIGAFNNWAGQDHIEQFIDDLAQAFRVNLGQAVGVVKTVFREFVLIGRELSPVFMILIGLASELAKLFAAGIVIAVTAFVKALQDVRMAIQAVGDNTDILRDGFKRLFGADVTSALDRAGTLFSRMKGDVLAVRDSVMSVGDSIDTAFADIGVLIEPAMKLVREFGIGIASLASPAWDVVVDALHLIAEAVGLVYRFVAPLTIGFAELILKLASPVWTAFVAILRAVGAAMSLSFRLIGAVIGKISELWDKFNVGNIVLTEFRDETSSTVTAFETVGKVIETVADFIFDLTGKIEQFLLFIGILKQELPEVAPPPPAAWNAQEEAMRGVNARVSEGLALFQQEKDAIDDANRAAKNAAKDGIKTLTQEQQRLAEATKKALSSLTSKDAIKDLSVQLTAIGQIKWGELTAQQAKIANDAIQKWRGEMMGLGQAMPSRQLDQWFLGNAKSLSSSFENIRSVATVNIDKIIAKTSTWLGVHGNLVEAFTLLQTAGVKTLDAINAKALATIDRMTGVNEAVRALQDQKALLSMPRAMRDMAADAQTLRRKLEELNVEYKNTKNPDLLVQAKLLKEVAAINFAEAINGSDDWRGSLEMLIEKFPELADVITPELLADPIHQAADATRNFSDLVDGLATSFSDLAEISGGALGGLLGTLAEMVGLMSVGNKAGAGMADMLTRKKIDPDTGEISQMFDMKKLTLAGNSGSWSKMIGNYMALGTSAASAYASMQKATDVAGRGNRAMRGAAQGASIGSAFGPWGSLIGAGFGAIWGAIKNPAWEDVGKRIGKEFNKGISEELSRGIADTAKALFRGDRQAAEIFALDKILGEVGLNDGTIKAATGKLRDVFSMLEQGKFTTDQAKEVIGKNFAALADFFASSGKVANKAIRDVIELNKRMGIEAKEVLEVVSEMGGRLGSSLSNLLAPLKDKYAGVTEALADIQKQMDEVDSASSKIRFGSVAFDDLGVDDRAELDALDREWDRLAAERERLRSLQAEGTQEAAAELERMGVIALAAFNGMKASGLGSLEAVNRLGTGLTDIIALQQELGITTENSALQQLIHYRNIVEANQAAFVGAQALNETIVALSFMAGGLSAETLPALAEQGVAAFDRLIEAGLTEAQAIEELDGFVENLIRSYQEAGIPMDEAAQLLMAQAEAAGTLGDEAKSMADILTDGFAMVTEAVRELADALGVLPQRMRDIPGVNVPVTYTGGPVPESELPHAASGGIATRKTVGVWGEAGPEALIPLDRLAGVMSSLQGGMRGGIGRGGASLYHDSGKMIADSLKEVSRAFGSVAAPASNDVDIARLLRSQESVLAKNGDQTSAQIAQLVRQASVLADATQSQTGDTRPVVVESDDTSVSLVSDALRSFGRAFGVRSLDDAGDVAPAFIPRDSDPAVADALKQFVGFLGTLEDPTRTDVTEEQLAVLRQHGAMLATGNLTSEQLAHHLVQMNAALGLGNELTDVEIAKLVQMEQLLRQREEIAIPHREVAQAVPQLVAAKPSFDGLKDILSGLTLSVPLNADVNEDQLNALRDLRAASVGANLTAEETVQRLVQMQATLGVGNALTTEEIQRLIQLEQAVREREKEGRLGVFGPVSSDTVPKEILDLLAQQQERVRRDEEVAGFRPSSGIPPELLERLLAPQERVRPEVSVSIPESALSDRPTFSELSDLMGGRTISIEEAQPIIINTTVTLEELEIAKAAARHEHTVRMLYS